MVARALGLTRYFTGETCSNGHVAWRRTSDRKCMGCRSEHKRRQRAKDRVKPDRKLRRACRVHHRRAPGTFTIVDLHNIWMQQKGRCAYCHRGLREDYTIDHIVAVANGGTNDPSNLQLTCPDCNSDKGAKDPIFYAKEIGRLL